MQSFGPVDRQSGWPLWAFFAATPLVLALGLIIGITLATYLNPPDLTRVTEAPNQTPLDHPAGAQGSDLPPQPDSSWQIATPPAPFGSFQPSLAQSPEPLPQRTPSGPVTIPTEPVQSYFPGTPSDAREASRALNAEFNRYAANTGTVNVAYQQMRQAGQATSLVGTLTVSNYTQWMKALQDDPDALTAWLEAAAKRVQKAAIQERFFLTWAVVEATPTRPEGFTDDEVTPLENGMYLVIRPLASTSDYAKTEISLRPIATPNQASTSPVATAAAPWSSYAPKLHFDNTDLFRPEGAHDTRPSGR